jgi:hypothetical protein
MRFGGLHISDLFVTNPELSKLQLLCLGDEERDTGYGTWLPILCPVHLIFVVRRWRRPSPNLKFSENRADQSLEFFDFRTLAIQCSEFLSVSPQCLFAANVHLLLYLFEISTRHLVPHFRPTPLT